MPSHPGDLNRTPLTGWHEAAGARMADFAGWTMPLEYPSGTVTEHKSVRSGCGIFDVSHMGTLYVLGTDAIDAVNGVLTNDLARLAVGDVQYTLLCNDAGGVIDDMLATRIETDQLMIVPNAANSDTVAAALRVATGTHRLIDAGTQTAILAVQGPTSAAILSGLGLPTDHDYMTVASGEFDGIEVIVSRTGYTGERGYELLAPNPVAVSLWEEILDSPRVTPAGLGARDTLRTEMGYALHGQDIGLEVTPVEALLGWAVAWDKPSFTGRDALLEQKRAGATRALRGLRVTGRGVLRPGMTVHSGADAGVGVLTSGTFSPSLNTGIGLALLDRGIEVGSEVFVDVRGRRVPAEVVRPPFVGASPK